MKNIEFSNCMQVIGIIGILQSETEGAESETEGAESEEGDISETEGAESEEGDISETEGAESEDGDIVIFVKFWGRGWSFHHLVTFVGADMLKWFNHQSVDNSIFFSVGRNFPKLVVCIVPGPKDFDGFVEISINGYENREYQSIHLSGNYTKQYLFSLTQWSRLQRHLNESNPTDQNRVKVSIRYKSDDTRYSIKRWGVHVECTCHLTCPF